MGKLERPAAVRQYITFMRVFGVLYAASGAVFFFFPKFVFTLLNLGPSLLGVVAALPESTEYFWLPLATSMMVMLSLLCFLAAANPEVRGYAWVQFASKCTSSLGYLYYFLYVPIDGHPVFAYLVGVLTDLPIALLVLFLTLRVAFALRRTGGQELPVEPAGAEEE